MLELTAQGPGPDQQWSRRLAPGESYELGRQRHLPLCVAWDERVSRRHARLRVANGHVLVERLPEAANPIFYGGRAVDECGVRPGEQFVIGGTSFRLTEAAHDAPSPGPLPVEELTFDRQELRNVRFSDADKRIEVLTRLPEVIWGARTESELHERLVDLILTGVEHAEAVAIVEPDEDDAVRVLHWDRRRATAGAFRPSARLVGDALTKRRRSVLHVWETHSAAPNDYTAVAGFDWAYCTPVAEQAAGPWGVYVAGRLGTPLPSGRIPPEEGGQLRADVKFTEFVCEIVGTVRRLNELERQRAGFRQFFAPPILAALGDDFGSELLEPRECDVTVMFCDLRGFSQQAEEAADDLPGLLERVSRALGVMTHWILHYGGVTGDFQGDAALAFWGWPFASDQSPINACRAALAIRRSFAEAQERADYPLRNFRMGIGIAHGRAVAGKIGTSEQVKVTVFGPVVNLASRLEGMTKPLRVPIALDAAAAEIVRERMPAEEGRVRKLARVLPYGMESPIDVHELLGPLSETPDLTDEHLRRYEEGVEHFIAGRWEEAYRRLHDMPADDQAQDFLALVIAQHNRCAPPDWDGVVRLPGK
ncbi:MAG: adenylate/guanylate cyclase domain-containing protein [Planctomycetales bacterium]